MPARNATYLEASVLYAQATELHDADGARVPYRRLSDVDRPTTYRDLALVLYGEAGLGHGLALEGDLAFKRVSVEEPAALFSNSAPADLRLRLKRALRSGGWLVLAASADAKVPLGYDATEYPALGSGEPDFALQAHAGAGLGAGWVQAELGARHRGGPASDEWPFALQGGFRPAAAWTVVADVRGHGRLGGRGGATSAEFDPALASSSVVMAGPGVTFAPTRNLSLGFQAWRSLAGRNMPAGWKWKLALARVR
ncbi:MAG: hypothetical protein ABIP29_07135 [Candidatus Eisenbacteria bacterium]